MLDLVIKSYKRYIEVKKAVEEGTFEGLKGNASASEIIGLSLSWFIILFVLWLFFLILGIIAINKCHKAGTISTTWWWVFLILLIVPTGLNSIVWIIVIILWIMGCPKNTIFSGGNHRYNFRPSTLLKNKYMYRRRT